eukprot:183214-Pyramimonas_sp.AAC.1
MPVDFPNGTNAAIRIENTARASRERYYRQLAVSRLIFVAVLLHLLLPRSGEPLPLSRGFS